jgi:hypothetical protein
MATLSEGLRRQRSLKVGGGGDDNSDDNHRRGGGALVTNRGREAREERSGVHTVLAKEEERGEG